MTRFERIEQEGANSFDQIEFVMEAYAAQALINGVMMQIVGLSFHKGWVCVCGQAVPADEMHSCENPQPCEQPCYMQLPNGDRIEVRQ